MTAAWAGRARSLWSRLLRREQPVDGDLPVFCIVTPVFNGVAYIDDTIRSVLAQSGDFVLHYHVQDGGSTDGTLDRVREWMRLSRILPPACRRLVFTCASEPDGGMYDAINKGFARALPEGADVVMGWIAADDRVAPGACATIAAIRAQFPDIRFLGGRISLIDQAGGILGVHQLVPFSRRCMAAGLYDGRAMSFIMQEGSFWCADVWRAIGGLDTRFRLAGDWDLWRRLARHADYISVDSLLGFHRRRPGQLSEQMDRYYREVDALLDAPQGETPEVLASAPGAAPGEPHRSVYVDVAAEHEQLKRDPPRFREANHAGAAVRYNLDLRRWERMNGFSVTASVPELVTVDGATIGTAVTLRHGFRAAEGPYPEFGLTTPIRWMIAPAADGEVVLERPGRYRSVLRCRSWLEGQTITILVDDAPLGSFRITPYQHDRDLELVVEGDVAEGARRMTIAIDQPEPAELYLLVISWRLDRLLPALDRN